MYLNGTHAEQSLLCLFLMFACQQKREAIQEREATAGLHSVQQGLVKRQSGARKLRTL